MKFRLLFLGMVAAAFMVSCNNEIEGPSVGPDGNGFVESTNTPTYFSMMLPDKPATSYAGVSVLGGIADEKNIGNIAVFVYKVDAAMNTFPENYAFISTNTQPVILKTTDGTKKVFVALNVGGSATSTFFGTSVGAFTNVGATIDEGAAHTSSFAALNQTLWSLASAASPGWQATALTSGTESTADGLIKAFAGGSSTFAQGWLSYTGSPTANSVRQYLMSNWDNATSDTISGSAYQSTCYFTFKPDVPKSDLTAGTNNGPANTKKINVQRAVAKATLKFSTPTDTPNTWVLISDGEDDDKGKFTPWNAASATAKGVFVAGNINKESSVFQKFTSGSVSDENYGFISCDPAVGNGDWYANFDNTRVYGLGKKYRGDKDTPAVPRATVTDTKAAMTATGVGQVLGTDSLYLTENAQEYTSGYQDNSTYLVVGGVYAPRKWISNLIQSAVHTNAPITVYNESAVTGTEAPGTIVYNAAVDAYKPITYSGGTNDSLYYHSGLKTFFRGRENVEKYYAWVMKKDGASPAGTATQPWSPAVATALTTAIQNDIAAKTLVAYFQGNCFYRVFISDKDAPLSNERVLIRRNHVYDVNITKILGPGIADPNDIIIPGQPVLPADTYIQVSINIQDWHRVYQEEEVKGE